MENSNDYMRGMRDCKDGLPHLINQSKDYDSGFSDQYFIEQSITGLQVERENERNRRIKKAL